MCKIYVRSIEHVLVVKIRTHNQCNAVMLGPFFLGRGVVTLRAGWTLAPRFFCPNQTELDCMLGPYIPY